MAAELHPRSGKLIGLSNSNRTAQRNQPVQEFNHGLVLSREPLRDRDVFTVRIDKKVKRTCHFSSGERKRLECEESASGMGSCPQCGASRCQGVARLDKQSECQCVVIVMRCEIY